MEIHVTKLHVCKHTENKKTLLEKFPNDFYMPGTRDCCPGKPFYYFLVLKRCEVTETF